MKNATIPSLRVEAELRASAEQVLQEGESLSSFVEASIRESIARRRAQQEFIARGLRARDQARATNAYVSANTVVRKLEKMLATAKKAKSRA